ncbi:hypothetical protein PENTCL1PPCAC_10542, partial [Pristionchus entomophagus]
FSSLDLCFGCNTNQSNVVREKMCDFILLFSTDSCDICTCPPTWCGECLGRVFAAAQPEGEPESWMEGTASCPTCRATFCANDVLLIVDD